MKKTPLSLRLAAPLLTVLAAAGVRADSATWAGADGTWATLSNWAGPPAAVPGTGDTATFSTGGATTLTTGATVAGLVFDGGQNYALNGPMTLDAGGTINVAATGSVQTIASTTFTPGGSFTITNNSTTGLTYPLSNTASGGLNLTSVNAAGASPTTTLTFDGSGVTTVAGALAAAPNSPGLLTTVVKNGSGTLVLGNASNTNIWGGFTLNAGTTVLLNTNALSNRGLNLAGGNIVYAGNNNPQSFNSASAIINVSADTQLTYAGGSATVPTAATTGNWRIGGNAGAQFVSTGTPTVTFNVASPNINGFQLNIQTQAFTGTWKLGQNGALSLNQNYAPGSTGVHLDMGDSGTGSKYFGIGAQFTNTGATQTLIPVRFGALSGTETGAILGGRQNTGTGTTGVQIEVGSLNTSTTYAGTIRDGHTSAGVLQTNGAADGTGQNRAAGTAGTQGTVEFIKTGTGTLTLTGANSHTGGTVIRGGTLAVSSDSALGAAYTGSLRPFQLAAGTGVYSNTDLPDLTISGGSPATPATAQIHSATLGNNASNNLFLSFSNPATHLNDTTSGTIPSNNAGTGYISTPAVTLTGGTLGTAGTVPVVEVRVQGLLTLDGGTLQTNAAITSNRAIHIPTTGAIQTMGFDSTFSGNINGPGSLNLNGGGTLTLSAANSLTGLVTVGAGTTLNLAGSLAGSVTVAPGASLEGSGSAAGGAAITGEISPGNSIGQLNFGGPVTLAGTTTIELDATGLPNADLINATGPITLGGDLNVTFLGAPGAGTYNIIDATSFSGSFSNVNLPALLSGLTWDTSLLNTQGILTVVPEAGTTTLSLLAALTLLRRRRKA